MARLSAIVLLALSTSGSAAAQSPPAPSNTEIAAALAKVAPSLVRIHVVSIDYQDGREIKREASGSGTIISADGHIVTNHHVAGRTRAIRCTLANREEMSADLVGTDPLSDIAVLKLRPATPRRFPVATFGDESTLAVGDRVLALGSPLALSQSVTMGIVSNTEMIMPGMFWPFNRMTLDGEDVGSIVRWIGHDAPIFGGNSGGPLVDMEGRIVGVNEISLGLAGAIPAGLAREVAEAIMAHGRVRRAWIGLEVQPLLSGASEQRGGLVGGTIDGSPAAAAGFQSGDLLLKLAGQDVNLRFAEEVPGFNLMVMRLPVGTPVAAVVRRNGAEKILNVVPILRESVDSDVEELPLLGITGSELTAWSAKELRRASRDGVRVRGVRPGGPADRAAPPLRNDDVIVAIEKAATPTIGALTKAVEALTSDTEARVPALVAFERGSERLLTVVDVGRAGLEDPGLEARKAWVPVSVQVLTRELAATLGLEGTSGVRISRVMGGSAEKARLKVGDVVSAVDGERLEAAQPSDVELFAAVIRQFKIGASVTLSVIRDGKAIEVPVTLDASPRLAREMKKYEDQVFGFRVRDIAVADRLAERLPAEQPGVLVDAVREGGWAALGHLADGDFLLAIDGTEVPDVETVQKTMTAIAAREPASVVLWVRRGIRTFFVEMQASWR